MCKSNTHISVDNRCLRTVIHWCITVHKCLLLRCGWISPLKYWTLTWQLVRGPKKLLKAVCGVGWTGTSTWFWRYCSWKNVGNAALLFLAHSFVLSKHQPVVSWIQPMPIQAIYMIVYLGCIPFVHSPLGTLCPCDSWTNRRHDISRTSTMMHGHFLWCGVSEYSCVLEGYLQSCYDCAASLLEMPTSAAVVATPILKLWSQYWQASMPADLSSFLTSAMNWSL